MPMPRPSAGRTASGIEMIRISTKTAASAPSARTTQALGNRRRQLEARLAQRDDRDHGEPDEEHELAENAAVPADHGQLDADARAGVPVHERREREDEPGHPGDAFAGRPQAAGRRPRVAGRRVFRCGALEVEEVWRFHGRKYGQESGRRVFERSPEGVKVLETTSGTSSREQVDYVDFVTTGAPATGRVSLLCLRLRRDRADDAAAVPDVQRDDLGARARDAARRRRD